MGLDDVLDDGQTKPGTAHRPAPRLVTAVKALKEPRQMLCGNAATGIPDRDRNRAAIAVFSGQAGGDGDDVIPAAVFDGIDQQIDDRLLEQGMVHRHQDIFRAVDNQADTDPAGLDLAGLGRRLQDHPQRPFLQMDIADTRFLLDPRQGQQIVDDRIQPIGLAQHHLQELDRIFAVIDGTVEEGFDITADRGDRGPQLVGDIGDEVTTDGLEPPQFGHIVDDHQCADLPGLAVIEGDNADLQEFLTVLFLEDDFIFDRSDSRGQHPADLFLQIDMADNRLQQISPVRLPVVNTEQAGGGGVDADDPLLQIDGNHRFNHARKNRIRAVCDRSRSSGSFR